MSHGLSQPELTSTHLQAIRDTQHRLLAIHRSFSEYYSVLVPKGSERERRYAGKLEDVLKWAEERTTAGDGTGENTEQTDEKEERTTSNRVLRQRPSKASRSKTKPISSSIPAATKSKRRYPHPPKRNSSTVSSALLVYHPWRKYKPWRGRLSMDRLEMLVTFARTRGVEWRVRDGARNGVFLRRNLRGRKGR